MKIRYLLALTLAPLAAIIPAAVAWYATGAVMAQIPGALPGPIGQGGAAPAPPIIYRGPHAYVGGGGASVTVDPMFPTNCGTTGMAVAGTDTAGELDTGPDYVAGTQCQLKFAVPFNVRPYCLLSVSSATSPPLANLAVGQFGLVFILSGPSKVTWFCLGSVAP